MATTGDYENEDDMILQQQRDIAAGIAASSALIGERESFAALHAHFVGTRFAAKLPELEAAYIAIRSVRGDGNCFYRAYFIGCIEQAIASDAAFDALLKRVTESKVRCHE